MTQTVRCANVCSCVRCLCECVVLSAIRPLCRMHVAADLYTKQTPNEIHIATSTTSRTDCTMVFECYAGRHILIAIGFSVHIHFVGVSDAEQSLSLPCRWQCFCARILRAWRTYRERVDDEVKAAVLSLHFCRNVCVSARFSHGVLHREIDMVRVAPVASQVSCMCVFGSRIWFILWKYISGLAFIFLHALITLFTWRSHVQGALL